MFKNTRIVVETIRISLALLGQSFREQACARVFARVLDLKFRVAIDAKVERKKRNFTMTFPQVKYALIKR